VTDPDEQYLEASEEALHKLLVKARA